MLKLSILSGQEEGTLCADEQSRAAEYGREFASSHRRIETGLVFINDAVERLLSDESDFVRDLSYSEREILRYIMRGYTNREMAKKLYRVQRTVEYHRGRVMRKLGAANLVDLVKIVVGRSVAEFLWVEGFEVRAGASLAED
jgi:DNA-binding NarL/FixJ family response regulator